MHITPDVLSWSKGIIVRGEKLAGMERVEQIWLQLDTESKPPTLYIEALLPRRPLYANKVEHGLFSRVIDALTSILALHYHNMAYVCDVGCNICFKRARRTDGPLETRKQLWNYFNLDQVIDLFLRGKSEIPCTGKDSKGRTQIRHQGLQTPLGLIAPDWTLEQVAKLTPKELKVMDEQIGKGGNGEVLMGMLTLVGGQTVPVAIKVLLDKSLKSIERVRMTSLSLSHTHTFSVSKTSQMPFCLL